MNRSNIKRIDQRRKYNLKKEKEIKLPNLNFGNQIDRGKNKIQ